MGAETGISYVHHTFNPWWGCQEVSPACDFCYARRDAERYGKRGLWGQDSVRRELGTDHWRQPYVWNRKAADAGEVRRVLCGSMCDVMEEGARLDAIRKALCQVIDETQDLDWLMLTKRPQNFRRLLPQRWLLEPPANVIGFTTIETADYLWRWDELLRAPFLRRGISVGPVLGPITLPESFTAQKARAWLVAEGESGPQARASHKQWITSLRDQAVAAGVPFHFKQWGEWCYWDDLPEETHQALDAAGESPTDRPVWVGRSRSGRSIDGREWLEVIQR